jgi:hypothetical protein
MDVKSPLRTSDPPLGSRLLFIFRRIYFTGSDTRSHPMSLGAALSEMSVTAELTDDALFSISFKAANE